MVKRLARLGRKLPRFKYDLDMAVVEEAGSSFPAGQGIAGVASASLVSGLIKTSLARNGRPAPVLADSKPLLGSAPMASDSIA
jgi:hypothetical protein